MNAIQDLIHEHEVIIASLEVLDVMAQNATSSDNVVVEDYKKIVDFIKEFADKCHHGKEEDMLFPALIYVGFAKDSGPIAAMMADHNLGRELIKNMSNAAKGNVLNVNDFSSNAKKYIELMRKHISIENNVLFPLSETKLSKSTIDDLTVRFEEFEENVIGHDAHHRLLDVFNSFKNKYLI